MKAKRLLSLILCLLMISTILPVTGLAAGEIVISGSDVFVSAPEGKYSKMAYTATYTDGSTTVTDPTQFTWSIKEGGTDVMVNPSGELVVKGQAEGTYTIKAEYNGVSSEKTVTITKSTKYDWESADTSYTGATATEETDNNFFRYGHNSDKGKDMTLFNVNQSKGKKTVNFDFRVLQSTAESSDVSWASSFVGKNLYFWGDPWISGVCDSPQHIRAVCTGTESGGSKTLDGYYFLRSIWHSASAANENITSPDDGKKLKLGEWYTLSVEFDLDKKLLSFSVLGEETTDLAKNRKFHTNIQLDTFRFRHDVDNVVGFSGIECEEYVPNSGTISIAEDKSLIIPQAEVKTAQVKFNASVAGVEFSCSSATGVSIDPDTGIVSVTDAASAGSVIITASKAGYTSGTATLYLSKVNENLNSYADGTIINRNSQFEFSEIINADGNGYAAKQNLNNVDEYIGYYMPKANNVRTNGTGNIVIEYKCKGAINKLNFVRYSDQLWGDTIFLSASPSAWMDVKIIYNPTTCTYTVMQNGFYSESLTNVKIAKYSSGDIINKLAINSSYVDDLKIYNVSKSVPTVFTSLSVADGNANLDVKYIDECGVAEADAGRVITWYGCTDGGDWTEIAGLTDTAIDLFETDIPYNFLKAHVQYTHDGAYNDGVNVSDLFMSEAKEIGLAYEASIEGEEDVTVSIKAKNFTSADKAVMLVIADYEDNKLTSIVTKTVSVAKNGAAVATDSISGAKTDTQKYFIWDANTLAPLR